MKNLLLINSMHRSILRIAAVMALSAALIIVSSGCELPPSHILVPRNDLNARPSDEGATGIKASLLHFAQMSDIHIVDDTDPLRLENIKLLGYDLGNLDFLVQAISRDQDRYSARNWNAVIRSIDDADGSDPIAFSIMTGDHTDTGLKNEFRWFIDIADGVLSDSLQDAIAEGAVEEFEPVGLNTPWYAAVGNHDVEYEGTVNNSEILLALLDLYGDTATLNGFPDTVEAYKYSTTEPWWHGFANQPASSMANSYGYYSFDPNEIFHCIVLDTSIFLPAGKKETFSLGCLDRAQFDWMVSDIEANRDRLCVIFSHHSPLTGFQDSLSDVKAAELMKKLASYDNVIAHVNGHDHVNVIDPVKNESAAGGYWNINTCAIIDWPQEWRNITVKDNGDGTGVITCHMERHGDELCRDIASGDPDAKKSTREGTKDDRDVSLKFAIPATVKQRILSL
jgi:3',5'-cyclic AMP phosphodiesterase CpdA